MKNKTAPPPPAAGPINFYVTNRAYNLRMRDLYYAEVEKQFDEFHESLKADFLNPDCSKLSAFCVALETAHRYAKQAVFGLSPKLLKEAEKGPQHLPALLQEEFLLIHLLEEMRSSSLFIMNRFTTIREFQKYKARISALPKVRKAGSGYISKILDFIEENQKAEEEEIKYLILLKTRRIRLANRIFAVLKSTDNKDPETRGE